MYTKEINKYLDSFIWGIFLIYQKVPLIWKSSVVGGNSETTN